MFNEPSVVALETIDGVRRVKAVGHDAKLMMGKTPVVSASTLLLVADYLIVN